MFGYRIIVSIDWQTQGVKQRSKYNLKLILKHLPLNINWTSGQGVRIFTEPSHFKVEIETIGTWHSAIPTLPHQGKSPEKYEAAFREYLKKLEEAWQSNIAEAKSSWYPIIGPENIAPYPYYACPLPSSDIPKPKINSVAVLTDNIPKVDQETRTRFVEDS